MFAAYPTEKMLRFSCSFFPIKFLFPSNTYPYMVKSSFLLLFQEFVIYNFTIGRNMNFMRENS